MKAKVLEFIRTRADSAQSLDILLVAGAVVSAIGLSVAFMFCSAAVIVAWWTSVLFPF